MLLSHLVTNALHRSSYGVYRWNSVYPLRRYLRTEGSGLAHRQGDRVIANRHSTLRLFSTSRRFAMEDPRLQEFLDYLDSLKNYEKEGVPKGAGTDTDEGFDLHRMERLLQLLGDPLSHYPVVHIAGTKGKGSTTAFISSILQEEGYFVGAYTSPHLQTIRERIVTSRKDKLISVEALQALFQGVRDILDDALQKDCGSLTHFEEWCINIGCDLISIFLRIPDRFFEQVLTALAFKYFAEESVNIAIIETGLGGARDATNVIRSEGLATSVITTIGEEHMSALGGSLESIAVAKSGIIKHGRPVVLGGPFEMHIEYILRKTASSMNAPVISAFGPHIQSKIKSMETTNNQPCQYCDILVTLDEKDPNMIIELFDVRLSMLGHHQLQNAVTAICTALSLRSQGWKISDNSIRAGLECTHILGRFQCLTRTQSQMLGVNRATIILDGAHTEASAKALADTIMMPYQDKPLAFVVAMANDKNHSTFASQILSGTLPKVVILTEVSVAGAVSRTAPAASLLKTWTQIAQQHNILVKDWSEKQSNHLHAEVEFICSQVNSQGAFQRKPSLVVAKELGSVEHAVKMANELLELVGKQSNGIICVTGSLHIVSAVISSLHD